MPGIVPVPRGAAGPVLPSDDNPAAAPASAAAVPNASAGDAEAAPQQQLKGAARYLGTLMPGQLTAPNPNAGPPIPSPITGARSSSAAGMRIASRLTSHESSQQLQRLEHLCGLLRRQRHPVCPVNGMLVLLPFEMLKAADQDVAELERAVAADLGTIYRELQLRCPVTAVVVGMDQEKGFRELIRRIGRDDIARQRFGQRFDVRTPATSEELRKFTTHVCGTFEDWVYTMFRDEQALAHPGNTSLYAMLCKVRRTLKNRLGSVLGNGFGHDRQSDNVHVLFSGCYFAATGPKADRQAFVNGLLSKLYDEQEEIEWTEDALREDERRGWFIRVGWTLCGVVLLAAAGWFGYDNFRSNR
jgi:type VI protein secretion system component VasK